MIVRIDLVKVYAERQSRAIGGDRHSFIELPVRDRSWKTISLAVGDRSRAGRDRRSRR